MTSKETSIIDQAIEKPTPLSPSEQDAHFGHKIDTDEAFFAVSEQPTGLILDDATNKRILRKIDMILMPVRISFLWKITLGTDTYLQILCVVYGLNYLDSMSFLAMLLFMN